MENDEQPEIIVKFINETGGKKLSEKEKRLRYSVRVWKKRLKRRKVIERRKKHIRRLLQGKPLSLHNDIKTRVRYNDVRAPEDFSFLTNTEETIDFLNRIESYFNKRKQVFVVLKNVKNIDHSAITVLLSLMYKFRVAKIKFNGDFPDDLKVKETIVDSQFFRKLLLRVYTNCFNAIS